MTDLNIRGTNFDLTDAILGHVRARLADGLSYYAPRVRNIEVRVGDVNGPRGGMDKRCSIEVAAADVGTVCVEHVDGDLYKAIDRAVAQLRRQLAREFGRHRTVHRGPRISASGLPT